MQQRTNRPFKQILVPATIFPLLLLALIAAGLSLARPNEVQGSTAAGSLTITKQADPADGTDFTFTTNALPLTPTFTLAWGSEGGGSGQFNEPGGIAADAAGNLYVVDTFNHRVQKFDSGGNFLLTWGSVGSGNGQFGQPTGIAVDTAGNVYVADTFNHRVQKFDSSGNFLLAWGSNGTGSGQFAGLLDAAIDAAGNVYVSDAGNDRVQKFDPGGSFLLAWGSPGSGSGQFQFPFGLAINAAGHIYVSDNDNNRIQKFVTNLFALDDAVPDDGDIVTSSRTIPDLSPGSYTFTETVTSGWALDNITCDSGSWTTTSDSVTVTLADGEHITCTFTNIQPGQSSYLLFMPAVQRSEN